MTTSLTMATVRARIFTLPGRPPFMTAYDLAEFYEVTPKRLVEQVRRNLGRFPDDFIFEMTDAEMEVLVTQNAAPNRVNRGVLIGFTKEGALQLSSVLTGPVADEVSVTIIRVFAELERQAMADARAMVGRLQVEAQRKKPIYGFIAMSMQAGLSIDRMWRGASYPRWKLEQAAREMLAMRLIDRLPDGMQPDLFGNA